MDIDKLANLYDDYNQANITYPKNEYGEEIFVEFHAFANNDSLYIDGELSEQDLRDLADVLKKVKGG